MKMEEDRLTIAVIIPNEEILNIEDFYDECRTNERHHEDMIRDFIKKYNLDAYDEYDLVQNNYEKIDENTFILNGGMSVGEVEKILDIKIPEGDYDTISGYLIEEIGRIPDKKEKPIIEKENVIYKIEKVEDMRIVKIKACKVINFEESKEEEEQ